MLRHFALVSSGTLASRLTGFLRDALIAALLGAGAVADVFLVPFQIVSAARRLIGEGALNAALVPAWLKVRETQGNASAALFASRVLGTLTFGLAVVALVIALVAALQFGALHLDRGFGGVNAQVLTVWLMLPYLALAAPVAVLIALLNAQMRFGLAAFAPLLFNLLLIAVAFALLTLWRVETTTAAVILAGTIGAAGLVQLRVLQSSNATKAVGFTRPDFDPQMRAFLGQALPGMIASAAPQLLMLAGIAFAAATPGAASWLYFASRLIELPLGLVGVAMGTVMVPLIARAQQDNSEAAAQHERDALSLAFALAAPACVGLLVLSPDITRVLFQHGAFTPDDTAWTASCLATLALGLPMQVVSKTLSASFFGRGDTRTPMIATLAGLAVTIVLAAVMRSGGAPLIALAVAGGALVQAAWLIVVRPRDMVGLSRATAIRFVAIVAAATLMGAVLYFADMMLGASESWAPAAIKLAVLIALGLGIYALVLRALGVVTLGDVKAALKREG
jgi:putative peptidoglycan lipid II flippase